MRLFRNADYKFIQKRQTAYWLSGLVILVGLVAMLVNLVMIGYWQNYGVDFLGGSLVQVSFTDEVTTADVRDALGGVSGPDVTRFTGENEFVIRAANEEGVGVDEIRTGIEGQLISAFGRAGSFEIQRTDLVGPKIGVELQQKAAGAILFSFLLTLIYLAMRFEFRFGVAAVIATAHDVLITLGFLALFRVEIALATVAAILTILGYSLNDTIVVFDRVRENMAKKGARKEDPVELLNRSINETLPRTVLTSGTTLIVLLSLLIFGGPVIRPFSIVLILGVVIGTYSSIFVASPALIEIRERFGEKDTKKKERPRPATV